MMEQVHFDCVHICLLICYYSYVNNFYFEVENKRGRKPYVLPNTVSKPIGPGTFLCGDRFIFFRKDNKFECAECSAVLKQRSHMVRHIRLKHMKGEETEPFLDANESAVSKSKNLVGGFDGDELEAVSDIQNDEHHDVVENTQPKGNYSCSAEDYGRGEFSVQIYLRLFAIISVTLIFILKKTTVEGNLLRFPIRLHPS